MSIKSWLLTLLISSLSTFLITLFYTPHILMAGLTFKSYLNDNLGVLQIRPQAQADKDNIVRMSPDLLYSACTFDISNGPLQITAPKTGNYVSISFFASNSDNFFAINDKEVESDFNIVLTHSKLNIQIPEHSKVIEAPSGYGLVLIRYYLGSMNIAELDELRHQAKCKDL